MFYTPLRYPGGKGKLASYLMSIFDQNDLYDGHYVEPYAGGAAVALELLMLEYASHIHINDIDPAVHAFWHSVLNETECLCKLISKTRVSMTQWEKNKKIIQAPNDNSLLDLGFATFFLNRTNRSGILKGGVIGGKKQLSDWKINCRYNKVNLIKRIEKISLYKDRISLYKKDAVKLLKELAPTLPSKSLIYLDPPYYVKGKGLYRNFYNHDDHVEVEKNLRKIKNVKWMVSYDDVKEIHEIYQGYNQKIYSLNYTAQTKMQGQEVIIYGPNLKFDENQEPYSPKRKKVA